MSWGHPAPRKSYDLSEALKKHFVGFPLAEPPLSKLGQDRLKLEPKVDHVGHVVVLWTYFITELPIRDLSHASLNPNSSKKSSGNMTPGGDAREGSQRLLPSFYFFIWQFRLHMIVRNLDKPTDLANFVEFSDGSSRFLRISGYTSTPEY